jgi:hypothetical protein
MERDLANRLKFLQNKLKESMCLLIYYIDSKEIINLTNLCNCKVSFSGEKIYNTIYGLTKDFKTCGIDTNDIYKEIIGTINEMISIENQKQLISSKSPKIIELFPSELPQFISLKCHYYGRRGIFGFYGAKCFNKIRHIDHSPANGLSNSSGIDFLKKSIKKDQEYFEKLDKLAEKRRRLKVSYTYTSGPIDNPICD